MMDQESSRQKTAAIVAKALQDDGYRAELLANPKYAIQQEFGKELPLGLDVRVVEESANVIYLVLPPKPVVELSDADLQTVGGGCYPLDEWLVTVKMAR
jgi:hypothetical protein